MTLPARAPARRNPPMRHTYYYRVIEAGWGVAVGLAAEARPASDRGATATEICEGMWLEIQPSWLSDDEREHLKRGLLKVAVPLRQHNPFNGPVLVRVVDLHYNPSDYQVEGLFCAICGWAAATYGFEVPKIEVSFDKTKNRYLFRL